MQILDVSGCLASYMTVALSPTYITMEMVAKMFPSIHLIFIEGQPPSSVETIVAARQLSGRPVTVVQSKAELDNMLKSYTTVSE
jgi:hypothetical protein